jgi:hypothetical protein
MSKTPTILKKDDSQRSSRAQTHHQPVQPKILTKAIVKENVPVVISKKVVDERPLPPKKMKSFSRLVSNFQLDTKCLDYLDSENK